MATSNGKKNDAIYFVLLLLVLLLAGWIAWKFTTAPTAQPRQPTAQTNNYSPISNATSPLSDAPAIAPAPANDFSTMPAVTFTPPISPAPPPPARIQTPPSQTAQPTTQTPPNSTTRRPRPKNRPNTNPPRAADPIRPGADYVPPPDESTTPPSSSRATTPTLSATPPFPTSDAGPKPGSQLQGYAIIIAKQQDPATGRYLLAAVDAAIEGQSKLTYIYEVDAATFNEAAPGLMYNPAKVAAWKFVNSFAGSR